MFEAARPVPPPPPAPPERLTAERISAQHGFLSLDEVAALKELASSLPGRAPKVVNIGAGVGTSAVALLESRRDLRLWSIDKQRDLHPWGSQEAEQNAVLAAKLYSQRFRQVAGSSERVGAEWEAQGGPMLDMLFIDGGHSYEQAKADILAWLPHVRTGGIVALHDYEEEPADWVEVYQAVEETLVPFHEKIMHVDNLGAFRVVRPEETPEAPEEE